MLQAVSCIYMYILHCAIWPSKRSVLEGAVCHLAACSDNDSVQDEFDMLLVITIANLDANLPLDMHLLY